MKTLLFALLCCASASAQSLSFYIDATNGQAATDTLPLLPSSYQFPDTPAGEASSITIRVVNSSTAAVTIGAIYVGASVNSSVPNWNFTITGWDQNATIAPQAWKEFKLHFAPLAPGPTTAYLQAQALENGINTISNVSTLQGNGTSPQIALTCSGVAAQCNGNILQPYSSPAIDFGNVSTSAPPVPIIFTLTNYTQNAVNTTASLSTEQYIGSAFSSPTLPINTIPPNSSVTFTVNFAPGEEALLQGTLAVSSAEYDLTGTGIASVSGDISSLTISCTDQTGTNCSPQGRTIDLGTINAGTNGTTLTFQVSNPQTTINAVTIPSLSVPAGFTLSTTWAGIPGCPAAPPMPATVQPGQCMSFQLVFSGSAAGAYGGTLAIGGRQFQIVGTVPRGIQINLMCGTQQCPQTFSSSQQVQATLEVDASAPPPPPVTLAISAPSLPKAKPDPAIAFISVGSVMTNLSNIGPITVGQGSVPGTPFTFATGTTAGTITITPTYLGQAGTPWSITIPKIQVQITSVQAKRQDPNLVVTLNGYDNTYSAGQLSFTFYDLSGRVIATVPSDATSDFKQYFFGPEDAGGAFGLQASFPVTGDVNQVGSVAVSVTNSVGTTTPVTQPFQ